MAEKINFTQQRIDKLPIPEDTGISLGVIPELHSSALAAIKLEGKAFIIEFK